jgi:hypothetical protein
LYSYKATYKLKQSVERYARFRRFIMISLKTIAVATVAVASLATFANTAEAQYYPQGYNQQYGYEQPRLTKKQIAKIRAREQARREREARNQFLGGQRYRQPQYYEETYAPRQPSPYYGGQVIVQQPQQYYYPQQQYVPPQPRYVPQAQPQYYPQQQQGWRGRVLTQPQQQNNNASSFPGDH